MRFKTGSLVLVLALATASPRAAAARRLRPTRELRHHDDHRGCDDQLGRQRRRQRAAGSSSRSTPTSFASVKNCAQLAGVGEKFAQAMAAAAAQRDSRASPTSRPRTNRWRARRRRRSGPTSRRSPRVPELRQRRPEGGLHARQGSHRVADRGAGPARRSRSRRRTSRTPSSISAPGRATTATADDRRELTWTSMTRQLRFGACTSSRRCSSSRTRGTWRARRRSPPCRAVVRSRRRAPPSRGRSAGRTGSGRRATRWSRRRGGSPRRSTCR